MYAPEFNAIWIPLGILHSPFFQSDRLSASNFGALGMVLGHELTHAFDNTGALFDKNGIIKVQNISLCLFEHQFERIRKQNHIRNAFISELVVRGHEKVVCGTTKVFCGSIFQVQSGFPQTRPGL